MAAQIGAGKDFNFRNVQIFKTQTLGIGSYGLVYRGKCDQLPCAAKLLHPVLVNPRERRDKQRLRHELDQMTRDKQRLRQELDQMTRDKQRLRQELDQMTRDKQRLRHELDHMTWDKQRLRQKKNNPIEAGERQLRGNEHIIAEFQQTLVQKDKRIRDLEETISTREREVQDVKQQQKRSEASKTAVDTIKLNWWQCPKAPHRMARGSATVDGSMTYRIAGNWSLH